MKDIKALFGLAPDTQINERDGLKNALSCCDNVAQMFDLLKARYDLENCKPGTIAKATLVNGLLTAHDLLKPAKK